MVVKYMIPLFLVLCLLVHEGKSENMLRTAGEVQKTQLGWKVLLAHTSPSHQEHSRISFEVEMRGDSILHIKFGSGHLDTKNVPKISQTPKYEVNITSHNPFTFHIVRKSTNTVIWNSKIFSVDQGLQVHSLLPTLSVYGLHGNTVKNNIFYECLEDDGNAHGVLIPNANDMELTPSRLFTFKTAGDSDIYIFLGPSPESVVQQYSLVAGRQKRLRRDKLGPNFNTLDITGSNLLENSEEVSLEDLSELLPYLYTLHHRAATEGITVLRPLFHEYPHDRDARLQNHYMLGSAVLSLLFPKTESVTQYIPDGQWYSYNGDTTAQQGPKKIQIQQKNVKNHFYLREGFIVPVQVKQDSSFGLKVALPGNLPGKLPNKLRAEGVLYWDDGQASDNYENGKYYWSSFTAQSQSRAEGHYIGHLKLHVEHNHPKANMDGRVLDTVEVMGVLAPPKQFPYFIYLGDTLHESSHYNHNTQVLTITNLRLPMAENMIIEWRTGRKAAKALFDRIDCCPGGCDQGLCNSRGCTWTEEWNTPNVPWCYVGSNYGYSYTSLNNNIYNLAWIGQSSMFGGDSQDAAVLVQEYGNVMRIKFYDPSSNNFEVPINLNLGPESSGAFDTTYVNSPFSLMVRRSDSSMIWDSTLGGLTIAERFLQLAVRVNCVHVFGFGENEHASFSHDMYYRTWGMFSRDEPPKIDANLYSVHPFYMCLESDGRANAVLLLNSNAQEVVMLPTPGILYRTTGGVLDFYILSGNTPEEVIRQYHILIGTPMLPPYWALGFHLSRYGYDRIGNIQAAVDRTLAANIPLDVQHTDIDVMDTRMDFTWDSQNFPNLPQYLQQLQSQGIHNIPILDPFLISNVSGYQPYTRGLQLDLFIKWPAGTSPDFDINQNDNLLGYAWPQGRVVFPDYFHPSALDYWAQLIVDFYNNEFQFDGIWLDMNDPANFGTDMDKPWNWPDNEFPYWSLKCNNDLVPRYRPMSIMGNTLPDKTICLISEQNQGQYKHYDVHSLYGWSQTRPTLEGLRRATGKRSLVVSRSTFPSSGSMAGKWLGDNVSSWPPMHRSIIGILEFNLFGIPFIGADVCGYFNDCPAQLCQRWMQLGAFYTFDRNHNGRDYQEQDPAFFGPDVAASSRAVLNIRYTLLPYLYTLFFQANAAGGTVIRPLANEFPQDGQATAVETQFLWGPALLISPVLSENTFEVYGYVPTGRWYDYHWGTEVINTGSTNYMSAPLDTIPLHVRGGYIIPTQQPAINTRESRKQPLGVIIAPDVNFMATGSLFWDDGESIDTVALNQYLLAQFHYQIQFQGERRRLELTIQQDYPAVVSGLVFDRIRAFSQPGCPTHVYVDGVEVTGLTIECDDFADTVVISGLQLPFDARPVFGSIEWTNI